VNSGYRVRSICRQFVRMKCTGRKINQNKRENEEIKEKRDVKEET
jgi:hypothetical protein